MIDSGLKHLARKHFGGSSKALFVLRALRAVSYCQRDPATTFPAASCSCYCHADKARECCDKCEPIHRGEHK